MFLVFIPPRPVFFNCVTFLFQLKASLISKGSHLHFAALQDLASSYLIFVTILHNALRLWQFNASC